MMLPPLRLNLVVALLCWLFPVVQPWQSLAFAPWKKSRNNRKEIVIHRIKSPRLGIHYRIDDLEISIDDPELYYDHGAEFGEHNNAMYYLATWKDESPVIGMVEVMPDFEDEDYKFCGKQPILIGLRLDDVVTAERYQRMGVGTALFQAIERDANELMESMELALHQNSTARSSIERRPPEDGRIDIRLCSARSQEALEFYRSMGYQFDPWQDKSDKDQSTLGKLVKRLKWIRSRFDKTSSMELVKRLDANNHGSRRKQTEKPAIEET